MWGRKKDHPKGMEEMIFGAPTGSGIVLVLTSQSGKLSGLENLPPEYPD